VAASRIMVIRHAEKADNAGTIIGVDIKGNQDPEELTVRGWQRAAALTRFFAPTDGHFRDQRIETPAAIFASKVVPHSKSLRSQHTVGPLADILGTKKLRLDFSEGQDEQLISAAKGIDGVVLISWHHGAITSKTRSWETTRHPENGTKTALISSGSSRKPRRVGVSSRFPNSSSSGIGRTQSNRQSSLSGGSVALGAISAGCSTPTT
jgi:hypothetical protein